MKTVTAIITVLGVISLIFILAVFFAYPTMWLINYLFSATILTLVFGTSKLTVLKALALNVFLGLFPRGGTSNSK